MNSVHQQMYFAYHHFSVFYCIPETKHEIRGLCKACSPFCNNTSAKLFVSLTTDKSYLQRLGTHARPCTQSAIATMEIISQEFPCLIGLRVLGGLLSRGATPRRHRRSRVRSVSPGHSHGRIPAITRSGLSREVSRPGRG